MLETNDYVLIGSKILGALSLLIFGMKIMSEALQKMAGPQLRHVLGAMTTNRWTGLLTGMFITVAVQSSSATTVMTVSFVNAGLLTLAQAISVIMGANIGTTLTAWIMSAGFSMNITDFVWPAFLVGMMLMIYWRKYRYMGDFLFGVAFMFFSLGMLSVAGKEMDLGHNETLINFFSSFNTNSYSSIILFLLIGTILTCIVQSSAALMAITMVLCSSGVLPIYLGVALVMGENIGTTMTANLAAITGNTQARRAALAHLVFNIIGVIWVLVVFYPFVNLACSIVGLDPTSSSYDVTKLSFSLAAFHTMFNITNTLLLIWFVPQIEKLVCWIIKSRHSEEEEEFHLKYIQAGLMKTPELSVMEAQREILLFAERMQRMFGMVCELIGEKDEEKSVKLYSRIEKYENISDNIEQEIAKYLENVSNAHLSDETKAQIRAMMREIGELESVGDACYNMARVIKRKQNNKEHFTEMQKQHINGMTGLLDMALNQMVTVMKEGKGALNINRVINLENEINNYRDLLKNNNITDLNEHRYSYTLGSMYTDIINECERLGDYVVNVVEARIGK